ncbi:serine hydrolase [Ekhidna sp.]|uniref:serine hydrolase domain-containing protein n=1 Tax=Ekhidna sp. TaxID=2608089 RepID=UPI003297D48F
MKRSPIYLIYVLFLCFSCTDEPGLILRENTTVELNQPWISSSPESVELDGRLINIAKSEAGKLPRMRSLLVIKNGYLVSESYFNGASRNTLFDVRSVTKSIVATLTFIALENGDLESLDKKMTLSPDYSLTADQQEITFRHLLSMSSGFEWDEWTSDMYAEWVTNPDQIQYVLDQPMVNTPGSVFTYNSGAVHLLGHALATEVNETLEDYAMSNLFTPLGIQEVRWEQLRTGPNSGAGIQLRGRDLARIGQLYLQEGYSGTSTLISANAIEDITSPKFDFRSTFGKVSGISYGYLWWTIDSQIDAFLAWGYGGQYILVVPSKNLVVVATTDWTFLSAEGGPADLERSVLDLIFKNIVNQQ